MMNTSRSSSNIKDSGIRSKGIVKSVIEFEHFEVVADEPTDHYYRSSKNSDKSKKPLNNASIMREWKTLGTSLPDSIYVNVYESRIDLLRAVIVGPTDTPYENGLFFFDILLPFDYPNQPPKVYYHSHGYRINPNLYANGKVCLSLLNTWDGDKTEKWTKKSTILQVLVSIQGLVLNERPFFNEPGYGEVKSSRTSEWINKSVEYNEDTLVLSCKTMLHTIRKPPKGFEGFVSHHFRHRAASILAAIKDYHDGRALIDPFQMQLSSKVSRKFKTNLRSLHCDFKKAFPDVVCELITSKTRSTKRKELSSRGSTNSETSGEKEKPKKKGCWEKLVSFGR